MTLEPFQRQNCHKQIDGSSGMISNDQKKLPEHRIIAISKYQELMTAIAIAAENNHCHIKN